MTQPGRQGERVVDGAQVGDVGARDVQGRQAAGTRPGGKQQPVIGQLPLARRDVPGVRVEVRDR